MQQHNLSTLKSRISLVLRRFYYKPLDLYAYSDGHMDLLRRSKVLRTSALISSFALVLLITAIIVPLYNKLEITEAATGTAKESSLSFNLTNSTASVDLSVNDANGTFASSSDDNSKVRFNISTTNYTGYTLSIQANDNTQQLINSDNSNIKLNSISSTINYDTFNSNDSYNNTWGYLPSKLNSSTNTSYLPAPTTTASTLDKTTTANSTANSYTIGIGARASYTTPAGEYTGTYVLTVVGNAIAYYVSFLDNSGDSTVLGLPSSLSGSVSATSITLPSTTPTRTGYTFKSWCLGTVSNNGTTCTGTQFNKGSSFGLDQTATNGTSSSPVVLYAVWSINTYAQTVEYYCQSATGAVSDKYTYTLDMAYGSTFTFTSANATNCYNSTYHNSTIYTANNGTASKTISYTVTEVTTNTAYFNRNTVTLTLVRGTGISSVSASGTGIKSGTASPYTIYYGGTVTISATLTSNYTWVNWTGSATYTSQSQSVSNITANKSFTANGQSSVPGQCTSTTTCMQTYTKAACRANASSSSITLTDARDGKTYTARYINGNCWMTQNLRLTGGSSTLTLTSTLSNVASSYKMPAESTSNFNAETGYTTEGHRCSTDVSHGCYYNYYSATAGTISGSSNATVATYDVCPKGWKLPTNAQVLTIAANGGLDTYVSAFSPVNSGLAYSSVISHVGERGYWWSATSADYLPERRYDIEYGYDSLMQVYEYRYNGLSIRCVLK